MDHQKDAVSEIALRIENAVTNGLGYSKRETFGLGEHSVEGIDSLHTIEEGLQAHLAALEGQTG